MGRNDLMKNTLITYIRSMDNVIIKNNLQARMAQRRGEFVTRMCRQFGLNELELYLTA